MGALSGQPDSVKVIHQYGTGLHSTVADADVNDPVWQQRQVDAFIDFAVRAEELGFDGISVTEHHVPSMVCPSPHLLLAAAAARTSRIRLGTAVTTLTLYNPVRVAEEAGMLDLLSGGRLELGLGKGLLAEAELTIGRKLSEADFHRLWLEGLRLFELAVTEKEFTFEGDFWHLSVPHTISARPLQKPLPVWLAGASASTMEEAGKRGWNIMRNFGTNEEHRQGFEHYLMAGAASGHSLSGANFQIERFIAISEDQQQAEENIARFTSSLGRFLSVFTARGRAIPARDTEFHVGNGAPGQRKRPAIAVVGTPDQVIKQLQSAIDETGARRLLVEMFTNEEMELFGREVLPALRVPAAATGIA